MGSFEGNQKEHEEYVQLKDEDYVVAAGGCLALIVICICMAIPLSIGIAIVIILFKLIDYM